ncbi:hypothetical protein AGDE_05726 [Angomonas deanei]|uniref:Uncharacterized protein n=1 Tax=Angomonas deanei TaxID=59799 RepID=A0A7G2C6Z4_9TRYP|nr:hypothetical protein AGDE_05726 [Angomonas deanei]CAD2215588.1 hypothetical protein, conserved [Angomonas deanei]|eukprot:EPY38205.1 hypothetical protein AGDE_05726 [Angomonas deanei]
MSQQDEIERLRAEIAERRAALDQQVKNIMDDEVKAEDIPPLEELQSTRVKLSEQVRHHKDEQDALELDLENNETNQEAYQLAVRVQRLAIFADRSAGYTENELTAEVEEVIAQDQRQSEEEVAAYIQELQAKREATLNRIANVQERSTKSAAKQGEAQEEPIDEEQQKSIQHAVSNVDEATTLSEKIKKFRALKTKLQGEVGRARREAKQSEDSMASRIRNAELTNARNTRQIKEINSKNAILTTNAQMLLNQLNVEHYGMDNAPTAKQIAQERREREATPEDSVHESVQRGESESIGSRSYAQSHASRRTSNAKPPLVAMKPTAAQRNRDTAMREERESVQRQRGMSVCSSGGDNRSVASSRRQSLSKPPLVANKPTAAQRSREEEMQRLREQKEKENAPQPRRTSVSSEGKPPSVAGKTTMSQRSRSNSLVG